MLADLELADDGVGHQPEILHSAGCELAEHVSRLPVVVAVQGDRAARALVVDLLAFGERCYPFHYSYFWRDVPVDACLRQRYRHPPISSLPEQERPAVLSCPRRRWGVLIPSGRERRKLAGTQVPAAEAFQEGQKPEPGAPYYASGQPI
jgi:hypothetical protein